MGVRVQSNLEGVGAPYVVVGEGDLRSLTGAEGGAS